MKRNAIVGGLVIVLGLSAAVSVVRSDEGDKQPPKMSEEQKAMMEAHQKASTPGPQHESFKKMVGKWKTEAKMWCMPGEPEVNYGTSTFKLLLGGRFVEENYVGESMGKPFEGRGIMGYDNVKKQYVGSWIDTMGTGISSTEGNYDEATKTRTMTGTFLDPTGKEVAMRITTKEIDANKCLMEMYMTEADGKEMKKMEIVYTRM